MIKDALYLFAILTILGDCHAEKEDDSSKKLPNIVIINIDDMGWKDVGYTGSKYYNTPNIDQLAQNSIVFTNAYAGAANCAPSRASLMTGLWPQRHGIFTVGSSERGESKDRKIIAVKNTTTLSEDFQIIPHYLHKKGYHTIHAGKWHLSDDPLLYGFEKNIGGGHNGHPKSYYPPYKNVDLPPGEAEYLTDLIMEHTINHITKTTAPFFLNYSPYAVHTPIDSVRRYYEMYEGKPGSDGQNNPKYASMVENVDFNIGLLLEHLKKIGKFNNTVFFFTTDNGGHFGFTRQYPLRAGKGSYYEGGIRVPFFIAWPEIIKKQSKSDLAISHLDILPTILDIAKFNVSDVALDGQSLLPAIKHSEYQNIESPIYFHFPIYLQAYNKKENETRDPLFRTRPGSVVIFENWKLHYYFEDRGIELYNLMEDIGEKINLAEVETQKKDELLSLLTTWWKDTDAPLPTTSNPYYQY